MLSRPLARCYLLISSLFSLPVPFPFPKTNKYIQQKEKRPTIIRQTLPTCSRSHTRHARNRLRRPDSKVAARGRHTSKYNGRIVGRVEVAFVVGRESARGDEGDGEIVVWGVVSASFGA